MFAAYRARTTSCCRAGSAARCGVATPTASWSRPATPAPTWCRCSAQPEDAEAFAERALSRRRSVSTIVGPHSVVALLGRGGGDLGTPPRGPLGATAPRDRRPAAGRAGPAGTTYRASGPAVVYPACVAMYTEEVGVSPEVGGGADLYRARITQLIGRGWSFARFERGKLVFKAEVACATPEAAQVQGVWVTPHRRGRPGRGRHGRRGGAGAGHDRPVGVALCQRLEPAGLADLRPRRLPRDDHFSTVMF